MQREGLYIPYLDTCYPACKLLLLLLLRVGLPLFCFVCVCVVCACFVYVDLSCFPFRVRVCSLFPIFMLKHAIAGIVWSIVLHRCCFGCWLLHAVLFDLFVILGFAMLSLTRG